VCSPDRKHLWLGYKLVASPHIAQDIHTHKDQVLLKSFHSNGVAAACVQLRFLLVRTLVRCALIRFSALNRNINCLLFGLLHFISMSWHHVLHDHICLYI
jgi:hypothetical protein